MPSDETTQFVKPVESNQTDASGAAPSVAPPESSMFKVSVRAWLSLLLTGTVCIMALRVLKVEEPLYSAFMLSLGFYFGQKK